ncbi:family 43 glycosylhydrolase [Pedobacter riviphilus]|uniref:Family 43 glycosylhydrolase n=1 Tax=Pedobacter riviphilus TaxID=2766984 RepID=A0ABX6TPH9_9SPHI|nr:family 43 glycosylhydrolase [Pedobacter riviphilus]QNR86830.1 family 43 glycosylhydrolase [Pedobacter riviphilus]
MNKFIITIFFLQFSICAIAQSQSAQKPNTPGFYTNPIFSGDYPDPSILRDGDNYYMVHSSFEYYPGLLIWHSKDLINWKPVTHALHKHIGNVWAPDLVKYKNKFYIYFPANGTNYVVWADSINGKWSDPVDLKISNIDPGHITDEQGKRYLFFSNGGFVPLSDDGLSIIGEQKPSYKGWPIPRNWSIECFCLEGPKLIKRGEYYYITAAEGGTAGPVTGHMVVSARSKSLLGPWENSPYNPIIRTKDNTEKWASKGHGTIIDDVKGNWWMIFHAYEKDFYNKGRQTLLLPIEWTKDGWYKVKKDVNDSGPIKKPNLATSTSNFTLNDNFAGNKLKPQWSFFEELDTNRFKLANNSLTIKAKGNGVGNSSPLLCIPEDHSYTVDVEMLIEGKATGGLVLFYNSGASSGMLANKDDVLANLRGWQFAAEKDIVKNHVFLRLKNINNTVDMYYSKDGVNWNKIENSFEVSAMHHNVFSGFLSLRIGLCAIGEGKVTFKNFNYKAIK